MKTNNLIFLLITCTLIISTNSQAPTIRPIVEKVLDLITEPIVSGNRILNYTNFRVFIRAKTFLKPTFVSTTESGNTLTLKNATIILQCDLNFIPNNQKHEPTYKIEDFLLEMSWTNFTFQKVGDDLRYDLYRGNLTWTPSHQIFTLNYFNDFTKDKASVESALFQFLEEQFNWAIAQTVGSLDSDILAIIPNTEKCSYNQVTGEYIVSYCNTKPWGFLKDGPTSSKQQVVYRNYKVDFTFSYWSNSAQIWKSEKAYLKYDNVQYSKYYNVFGNATWTQEFTAPLEFKKFFQNEYEHTFQEAKEKYYNGNENVKKNVINPIVSSELNFLE